jgi:hypothetical protein
MPDPATNVAIATAAAIRASVATVDGDESNPFGDIGHPTHIRNTQLREFGLDKAEAIADAIDDVIAKNDTSAIQEIVAAVGGVAQAFVPAPVLTALAALAPIAARLAA